MKPENIDCLLSKCYIQHAFLTCFVRVIEKSWREANQ